jgi:sulfur carrier protein ThiS adenylyltransferase
VAVKLKKEFNKNDFYSEFTLRNTSLINKKIKKVTIGIAGCGGLGSNAAIALVRAGIQNILIVDFDKVEITNLNRQQYSINDLGKFKVDSLGKMLKNINPFIKIEKHKIKLNEKNIYKVFERCKIVVEAFDTVTSKSMIIKAFSDPRFKEKYLIAGSGVAGYESANKIRTKRIAKNIFICGDNKTEPLKSNGIMAPRVMIAAGHQANKALQLIIKLKSDN